MCRVRCSPRGGRRCRAREAGSRRAPVCPVRYVNVDAGGVARLHADRGAALIGPLAVDGDLDRVAAPPHDPGRLLGLMPQSIASR